ncbi:hypothetical protein R70006_06281 [Paraburkholderia domus]|uniref:hypothetical protein n=1 Tax=Paraburkholderia domus TaxID=2793075 RepID=UPI00191157B0|nr:hypothetical protein [Paraburkholderia domus]MBK5052912.1 hypothetical protein [Burkholderia sp. R-70006]CAE6822696.1 hypothetical protein R70006_06281 [Paraburkholderia domus]
MAARTRAHLRVGPTDKNRVFDVIRKRIGEALQRPGLRVRPSSQLELAIATFAPSHVVIGFEISDYPFIGCRYVSVRDGHVYIVAGSTDDGMQVKAYRLNFIQSVFTTDGGIAVGITPDGWMESVMVMYSQSHEHFEMEGGVLKGVNHNIIERRSYPVKKAHVYLTHWTRRARARLVRMPVVGRLFVKKPRAENVEAASDDAVSDQTL